MCGLRYVIPQAEQHLSRRDLGQNGGGEHQARLHPLRRLHRACTALPVAGNQYLERFLLGNRAPLATLPPWLGARAYARVRALLRLAGRWNWWPAAERSLRHVTDVAAPRVPELHRTRLPWRNVR